MLFKLSIDKCNLLILSYRYSSQAPGFTVFFSEVCVAHFSFLRCVFCFICLRPVYCVLNAASVSGFFILNCHFGFLSRLFIYLQSHMQPVHSPSHVQLVFPSDVTEQVPLFLQKPFVQGLTTKNHK